MFLFIISVVHNYSTVGKFISIIFSELLFQLYITEPQQPEQKLMSKVGRYICEVVLIYENNSFHRFATILIRTDFPIYVKNFSEYFELRAVSLVGLAARVCCLLLPRALQRFDALIHRRSVEGVVHNTSCIHRRVDRSTRVQNCTK